MHIVQDKHEVEEISSEIDQEVIVLDRVQLEDLADKVMKLLIRELSLGKEREGKIQ